ncbi:hypothetical protein ScPMuIL_008254 [Solemya velum]
MLIYVESHAFPHKSFIVVVESEDKVARIRAQLIHILFEFGREDHQFRLRYNGNFLRDAFPIREYSIEDNALIKMIPMSKQHESLIDLKSEASSNLNLDLGSGQTPNVTMALDQEIKCFKRRENLLRDFMTLQHIQFLAACLSLLTVYWYAIFWSLVLFITGIYLSPMYTRMGGYVGNNTHLKFKFCVGYGCAVVAAMGVSLYLSAIKWIDVAAHGCHGWMFVDGCSSINVFTAIFFCVQALFYLIFAVILTVLFFNFKVNVGDKIEKYLVQEREIELVMKAARSGKLKERRTAAYELATMAASCEENKFRIVAEGGLNVLQSMSMCGDESTQEYALEAIAELSTIPSIQDAFVTMGGVHCLTALLHSPNERVMQEAANILYVVVEESEENKPLIIADHGLEDLNHAAYNGTPYCQQTIASIFLELAFTPEIRKQLTARNSPAQALISLSRSENAETKRYALQTLELLAIESSDMICAQDELPGMLLELPLTSMDEKLYLFAGKILLYYTENKHTCEKLLDYDILKESLSLFVHTNDPVLQKVIAKIIFCMLESRELRERARDKKLDSVLRYIRDNAADREAWDMADQGLELLSGQDEHRLFQVSTLEKLNKMGSPKASFGSRTSLGSDVKPSGSDLIGSTADMKHRD